MGSNKRWSFEDLYSILMKVCQQWGKTENSSVTEKENKHFAIEFSFNKLTDVVFSFLNRKLLRIFLFFKSCLCELAGRNPGRGKNLKKIVKFCFTLLSNMLSIYSDVKLDIAISSILQSQLVT